MVESSRIAFRELPWITVDANLAKRVVHGQSMSVTNYRFAPSGKFPIHIHAQEQITYCLAGKLDFTIDGKPLTISPGELVVIAPHVEHSAQASHEGAVVLSIVAPSRAGTDGGGITVLGGV